MLHIRSSTIDFSNRVISDKISFKLNFACVDVNRKVIDTEMRSFPVFIRVRSGQLEPFYYLLASKLPKRNFSPGKKGNRGQNLVFNLATNGTPLFKKSNTIRDEMFLFF